MSVKVDVASFHAAFFEEADEHLATMEAGLLELESASGDREVLARIFRAAHSIKGGAGTFGFPTITEFTHALETLLDRLRSGETNASAEVVSLLLRGLDALRTLVATSRAGETAPYDAALRAALLDAAVAEKPAVSDHATIRFKPGKELFLRGMDPLLVVRDVVALGTDVEVEVDASALPDLDALDPEVSHLAWTIRMRTTKTEAEIRDVFAFVEDESEIEVALPKAPAAAPAAPVAEVVAPNPTRATAAASTSTLRVSSEKLDGLIDLLGELVIAQSMVSSAVDDRSTEGIRRLREALDQMDRNTRELQDRVLAIRMVPIGTVFRRFTRVVHDIATSTGKSVRLELEGEETEIDKGMVEVLADPLMHLVRNAADHGIEHEADRVAAGKPAEGVLRLRALHQGGSVVIELSDDGRGLQTEKIREKARTLGLIGPDEHPSDETVQQLIFAPGFSTASKVTDLSGRGVGMDVVKRNVESASGSVSVSTVAGKGTTLRLRLPLTMAIMDGLSLRVGAQVFVAPLSVFSESFRPTRAQHVTVLGGGEVVRVRGETLPLVRLHRELGIAPDETDPTKAIVCVVDTGAGCAALLVDELLGQAQVVVKSLETHYQRVDGLTGATILGDGKVALILDVPALVHRATSSVRDREEKHAA